MDGADRTLKIEKNSRNVLTVRFDDVHEGWQQWFLLSSDHHFDSTHCDRELLVEIMDKARRKKAKHFVFGDMFDLMQGRDDKRRTYTDLRVEYKVNSYANAVLDDAKKFYKPYADQLLLITPGNHESKYTQKSNFDMITAIIDRLGGNIVQGCYGGYVRFMFTVHKTKRQSVNLKYHHGAGGGGEVTRGTIQTNRQAVYLPDADIVVNGHTHDEFVLPIARERLRDSGKIEKDLLWFVRTPSFKDAHADGGDGWDVETWKPPKPRGAVWLHFYYEKKRVQFDFVSDVR